MKRKDVSRYLSVISFYRFPSTTSWFPMDGKKANFIIHSFHFTQAVAEKLHLSTKIGHETKKLGIKIEYLYKAQ